MCVCVCVCCVCVGIILLTSKKFTDVCVAGKRYRLVTLIIVQKSARRKLCIFHRLALYWPKLMLMRNYAQIKCSYAQCVLPMPRA